MGLRKYREKRDFDVTPEPKGSRRSKEGFSYVIQKHAASHLHYDFRLELDGVLLSWAVPKGPSLDPKVRRLAMQTEDHPVAYGTFEGTIPQGEYGGGTVMVWDHGTWEPLDDPKQAYAKGHLRFALHGEKLRGAWHLVRTGKSGDKKQGWLLFKSHDAEERTGGAIIDEQPNSAKTGRTLEQIAAAVDHVWHSNRAAKQAGTRRQARPNDSTRRPSLEVDALLQKGSKRSLPRTLEPQQPTRVKTAPDGDGWAHELEYDGYRLIVRLDNGAVTLLNGKRDWTSKVPSLVEFVAQLPYSTALFDGEIAVLRPDGTTDVELLDNALEAGTSDVTFFAFDILYLNGYDLRSLPLSNRKTILEAVMAPIGDPRIHLSRHLVSAGTDFFQAACKLQAKGIVSKRLDRPYRAGKSRDWLKTECVARPKKGARDEVREPSIPKAPAKTRAAKIGLTHPERLLYPAEGITKQELADYYAAVSRWMLPHVANRPLTLVRCPQGFGKQTFFQKHAKPPLPKSIRAIPIADDGAQAKYMAIDDEAGLVSLAQMSVLEIHTWGAHADDPEKPDFLVFDLDPDPKVKWEAVIECARLVRTGLSELGLESYVKTTGGKGLHVCSPMTRRVSWDEAKEFCRGLAETMVRLNPKAYVATMSKAQRSGKIFIDFFRNGRGATFIAPYSTRAREGAPIAVPLAWDELSPKLHADHFNLRNVMRRMGRLAEDPWKGASAKRQVLSDAALRSASHPSRER
jgi:bifunctional non-homologous end joining protein LigD